MRCEWAQLRARGSAWWRRRPASGTRVCKPKLIQRSIPFVYLYAYVMYPLNEQPQGINKPRNHLDIISGVGYNKYRVYSRNISKRRLTDNETSLQPQSFWLDASLAVLLASFVYRVCTKFTTRFKVDWVCVFLAWNIYRGWSELS